jgi:hypothetical protein
MHSTIVKKAFLFLSLFILVSLACDLSFTVAPPTSPAPLPTNTIDRSKLPCDEGVLYSPGVLHEGPCRAERVHSTKQEHNRQAGFLRHSEYTEVK